MTAERRKSDETRKAMALLRRLSRAGAGLWDGIERGESLGPGEGKLDRLIAPVEAGETLASLLATSKQQGTSSKKARSGVAPQLAPSPAAKRKRAAAGQDTGTTAQHANEPATAARTRTAGKAPDLARKQEGKTKPAAQFPAPLAETGAAQEPANIRTHPVRSLKDVARMRSAQRRDARKIEEGSNVMSKMTKSDMKLDSANGTTHGTGVPFRSLADFAGDKAKSASKNHGFSEAPAQRVAPLAEGAGRGGALRRAMEATGPSSTAQAPAAPQNPTQPAPEAPPLRLNEEDPRLHDAAPGDSQPIARRVAPLGATPESQTQDQAPETEARTKGRDRLRLSDDADDLANAAWRNGVEPK